MKAKPKIKNPHPGRQRSGRKPSSGQSVIVAVNLTKFDLAFVDKRATVLGVSRSEYIRRLIRNTQRQMVELREKEESGDEG